MDMKLSEYGLEIWWVGSILDAEIFEGHFKFIQGQMGKYWCMDMKLGRWRQFLMPNIMKVTLKSSGVI